MNAWKLHGKAGYQFTLAVCRGLKIPVSDIYKALVDVEYDGTIIAKNGKKYILELKEIEKECQKK